MTEKIELVFTGDIDPVLKGLEILQDELNFKITDSGLKCHLHQQENPQLKIQQKNQELHFYFKEIHHFFREFATYFQKYVQKTADFIFIEEPKFDTCGTMLDCSRNAVPKTFTLKQLIRKMALLGMDTLLLYLEDTYEVKAYPYFGYMRGRYSQAELRACDEYAAIFGIELIPCIQTLAHLKEAIKWSYAVNIRDTADILLVGEPETYEFIDHLLKTVTETFRTKKIHIGMDEAHQLGLGKYLEENGFQNRFDIMTEHLNKVVRLCENYQIEPMIWSDMFFRLGSDGEYYNPEAAFPEKVVAEIPKVTMVYWDYYHRDPAHYEAMIKKHRELGNKIVFAGGIWTWNGMVPNYGKTWETTEAALTACKAQGLTEVFATAWGDNGAETPLFSLYPGLVLYAENCYAEHIQEDVLQEKFQFVFGTRLEDYFLLKGFDEVPSVLENNPYETQPSKYLLWQDVLLGLFDKTIEGLALTAHYTTLYQQLKAIEIEEPEQKCFFDYYRQFAKVLMLKSELGISLQKAYQVDDRIRMNEHIKEIQLLIEAVEQMRQRHRALWLLINKPFGWEVIDLRYGGVLTRLETASYRIQQWLSDEIPVIEELEEERLLFWPTMKEGSLGGVFYNRAVSASPLL